MVVFGLILVLAAAAVVAYMWLATQGMPPVSIDYGFLNLELSPLWLFLVGGITLAVLTSGIWLMAVGARSSARHHKEVRDLRRQAKDADRRAERSEDRSALDRQDGRTTAGTSGRDDHSGRSTGTDRGYGAAAGPREPVARDGGAQGADAPILPRHGSRADAPRDGRLDR